MSNWSKPIANLFENRELRIICIENLVGVVFEFFPSEEPFTIRRASLVNVMHALKILVTAYPRLFSVA